MNHAKAREDRDPNRFRMTLDELEKSAQVPLDKLVTTTADERAPAQTDEDRRQLDTRWAGGA